QSTQEMARVAAAIAGGDLTVTVSPRSERDTLGNALSAMVRKLSEVIGEARTSTGALLFAARQVSSSAQALAQGASEQAASVEETSTGLSQISDSITRSAAGCLQMEQMAQKGAADAAA